MTMLSSPEVINLTEIQKLHDECLRLKIENDMLIDARQMDAREYKRMYEVGGSGWINERIAQITAHRVCCGTEHDPSNGKLHGYCVVCGVPWPCAYAGIPPTPPTDERRDE